MPKAALITIGQTPRSDIVPAMVDILGSAVDVMEVGALDDLSEAEISALAPGLDDEVVVSRLRDGRQVSLSKSAIAKRVQTCVDALQGQVDAAVLLCTGRYPRFQAAFPVLDPDRVLFAMASAVHGGGPMGVIIPTEAQRGSTLKLWSKISSRVEVITVSPYTESDKISAGARRLRTDGVELVVLSCFGYTLAMKKAAQAEFAGPVLLPGSLLMRALLEAP